MKNIKPLFVWAKSIGDANINNRILSKVIPTLVQEKIVITDTMIEEKEIIEVPTHIYAALKESAEELLHTPYKEEK